MLLPAAVFFTVHNKKNYVLINFSLVSYYSCLQSFWMTVFFSRTIKSFLSSFFFYADIQEIKAC